MTSIAFITLLNYKFEAKTFKNLTLKLFRTLYEAAVLEKVWERYDRNMSVLETMAPNDTISLKVQHYKDAVREVQKTAIDNAMFISQKCTHYWTLFNAFYFSVTGEEKREKIIYLTFF